MSRIRASQLRLHNVMVGTTSATTNRPQSMSGVSGESGYSRTFSHDNFHSRTYSNVGTRNIEQGSKVIEWEESKVFVG